jgi:hypothetical protein
MCLDANYILGSKPSEKDFTLELFKQDCRTFSFEYCILFMCLFFIHVVIHFSGKLAMSVEGCFPSVIYVQLTGTWFLIVFEGNSYVF